MSATYGDPRLPDRFWDKVEVVAEVSLYPGPCWIWTASLDIGGYGRIRWKRGDKWGNMPAHRLAYDVLVRKIPKKLDGDHLCRIRMCANPDHVDPATRRENLMRGETIVARQAAQTHCHRGHPLDEANTYRWRGQRRCRTCHTENQREYDSRRKRG